MKNTTLAILAGTVLSLVAAQAAMAAELSTAPASSTEAPAKHAGKHTAAKHAKHGKKVSEKKNVVFLCCPVTGSNCSQILKRVIRHG